VPHLAQYVRRRESDVAAVTDVLKGLDPELASLAGARQRSDVDRPDVLEDRERADVLVWLLAERVEEARHRASVGVVRIVRANAANAERHQAQRQSVEHVSVGAHPRAALDHTEHTLTAVRCEGRDGILEARLDRHQGFVRGRAATGGLVLVLDSLQQGERVDLNSADAAREVELLDGPIGVAAVQAQVLPRSA